MPEQLAAQPLSKGKDGIYTAKPTDGTMITQEHSARRNKQVLAGQSNKQ